MKSITNTVIRLKFLVDIMFMLSIALLMSASKIVGSEKSTTQTQMDSIIKEINLVH